MEIQEFQDGRTSTLDPEASNLVKFITLDPIVNTTRSNNFTFRNEEFIVYLAGIVSLLVPMRILRLSFQFLRQTTMTNRALRDPISSYFFFLSKKED